MKDLSDVCQIMCPFQKLIQTCSVDKWAVVNFSARCDIRRLILDLMRNASAKGIVCFSFQAFSTEHYLKRAPLLGVPLCQEEWMIC